MKRSKEAVHYNRSRIKGKDTSIEKRLRIALYHEGFRYRKNVSSLPGHPDIVLTKEKIAIFCDGDFFHGYDVTSTLDKIKTNHDFWKEKIRKNRVRDEEENEKLVALGYLVLRFWEHEIDNHLEEVLNEIGMAARKREEEKKKGRSFS